MTKFAYPHLAARLFNAPLLIAHDKLRAILAAVGGRIVIGGTRAGMDDDEGDGDREVLPPYQMSGSIAIISLTGTLVARGAWIGAYSGLTSYQGLALQIGLALADPQVTGILLDIDSYGGEASGCFSFCERLRAACKTKPIYGLINESAFSAAYAIAAACEKTFIAKRGEAGSIGVWTAHVDDSGADEKAGIAVTYFSAGARKLDFIADKLTDEARTSYQAAVDRAYAAFVDEVATMRGLDPQAVIDTQAAIYGAADAVKLGLADEIGEMEDAISALTARTQSAAALAAAAVTGTAANPAGAKADWEDDVDCDDPNCDDPDYEACDECMSARAARAASAADAAAKTPEQLRAAAKAELQAEAQEIRALCKAANLPHLADEFISKDVGLDAARTAIQKARADQDAATVILSAHADSSPDQSAGSWDTAIALASRHLRIGQSSTAR